MMLTSRDLARLIDISAVRAQHGEAEIRELVQRAIEHRFIAVHVLPCWVPFLRELLAGESDIYVGAPVGFPGGAHATEIKGFEAARLVSDGVQEMDMMLNVGMLRSGRLDYVERDIRTVVQAAGGLPVKVILEVCYLSADQIKRACECAIKAGAAFVKTSTGWAPGGATLEIVELITSFVGNSIKVKAAGNVRDLDTVKKMLKMGVSRFGINLNASVEILRECDAVSGSAVEV
jgi:deoxyribose-phosphate aldolase